MLAAVRDLRVEPLRSQREQSIKYPPVVPLDLRSITCSDRGTPHVLEVSGSDSLASLKARITAVTKIPGNEVGLVSRGKRLDDDQMSIDEALGSANKLMILRQRAATAATVPVTLRCPCNGQCIVDFAAPLRQPISQILETAIAALGLKDCRHQYGIFIKEGSQLLRTDLCLSDYNLRPGESELYVVPVGGAQPPATEALEPSQPAKVRVPAAPAATATMQLLLPASIVDEQASCSGPQGGGNGPDQPRPAQPAPTGAPDVIRCGRGNAAEHAANLAAVEAAISSALQTITSDAQAMQYLASAAAMLPADSSSSSSSSNGTTANTSAANTAAGSATATSATAADTPTAAPPSLAGIPLPGLPGVSVSISGAAAPPDLLEMLPPSCCGPLAESDEQRAQRIEDACSQMVSSLAPATSYSSSLSSRNAAERKRDESSWGKGLSKGFLTRAKPKKRRAKKAPSETVDPVGTLPTKPVSQPLLVPPSIATSDPPADRTAADGTAADGTVPRKRASSALRCETCAARLPVTACLHARCRCGQVFCTAHLHQHACAFDYRAAERARIQEAMPKLSAPKLG